MNRWEQEICTFEEKDRILMPPKRSIVFVGSSTFRMWTNLEDAFAEYDVVNRGFGGARVRDVINYAERIVAPYEPRQVVVYAGGNDLAKGTPARDLAAEFIECITKISMVVPDAQISIMAILPHIKFVSIFDAIQETNDQIATYLKDRQKSDFIDIFTPFIQQADIQLRQLFQEDEIHLSQDGYMMLQRLTQPYLLSKILS